MIRVFAAAAFGMAATFMTAAQASGNQATDHTAAPSARVQVAQSANSCSAWKTICDSRGPGCDAKLSQCLKSGCWTEGPAYGGARHCGLAKR